MSASSPSRSRRLAPWLAAALLYASFALWYDGISPPLSGAEVEHYAALLAQRGLPTERVARLRAFLAADRGGDFVMVNLIAFDPAPAPVGEMRAGESGRDALARYMAYMTPALLARASHPLLGGDAAASALEAWGLADGERWSMAGVVRYRSRRDMIEIATDPRFRDAHAYKLVAMEKTLALPIEPYFVAGGPRAGVALVLIAGAALAHAALTSRGTA
ncbi:MAG: hypothetical protein ACHQ6V_07355 [Myxococcota bacterium]